jgi:hypothetical protein
MILLKYMGLYLRYEILNLLFLNSVVLISFCLQPSELNDIFNFAKKKIYFLTKSTGDRLIFGLLRYIFCCSLWNHEVTSSGVC